MNATLRKYEAADFPTLVAMYAEFEPKVEFQGLPPRTSAQIEHWLQGLRDSGAVQFVIAAGRSIVGHAMLCPGADKTEAELAIFLHQDYRGFGLGTRLLLGVLNYGCQQLHLDRVWLTTKGSNLVALRLFENAGFCSRNPDMPDCWEVEMEHGSHCPQCKGERCVIYNQTLPMTVPLFEHHHSQQLNPV